MAAVREQLPQGRYGRSADQRADRKLKIVGSVLAVVLLGVIGWIGYDYVGGQSLSAQVIKFKVVSDTSVEVHLEVTKDKNARGTCTLRAQQTSGDDVGRADFRFDEPAKQVDKVVTITTTSRATAADLVGCQSD
ncbi:DUF4307 domain-containing protein [Streptomyces xanthochromogenes]|uniref:Membrane protein n=1 Tax=Streptomyces xanthochromogenes TaxID=67384 RepID=A0ABQ3A3K0_9ACTN|nr:MULTISPECIES: DUF4307 domain-containing protein [Streptomyces]MYV91879.1 DUF4307 domain-containing protein [Streptomyces sp. SID1034]GGY33460.1 membrane protein [Streptomyces xanthochromogenes]GHB20723.1 membrane protein [Streptomyces xanthochromogenes]